MVQAKLRSRETSSFNVATVNTRVWMVGSNIQYWLGLVEPWYIYYAGHRETMWAHRKWSSDLCLGLCTSWLILMHYTFWANNVTGPGPNTAQPKVKLWMWKQLLLCKIVSSVVIQSRHINCRVTYYLLFLLVFTDIRVCVWAWKVLDLSCAISHVQRCFALGCFSEAVVSVLLSSLLLCFCVLFLPCFSLTNRCIRICTSGSSAIWWNTKVISVDTDTASDQCWQLTLPKRDQCRQLTLPKSDQCRHWHCQREISVDSWHCQRVISVDTDIAKEWSLHVDTTRESDQWHCPGMRVKIEKKKRPKTWNLCL